ncbi:hypothetical protein GA0061077_0700 [Bifidobacterium commune]|uniref:Uncharacterized protein n=1 Tax=Bifidobacterium commune TaxID=1505727 RepID=A0A1C4H416_9BIFI|nr:hypothetical protein GA0061077_0700 [Bifidobacterium commune]
MMLCDVGRSVIFRHEITGNKSESTKCLIIVLLRYDMTLQKALIPMVLTIQHCGLDLETAQKNCRIETF